MKRRGLLFFWAVATFALSLSSCTFLFAPLPAKTVESPSVQHVPYTGTFTYTVDPGASAHDVYFVFTNPSTITDASTEPTVNTNTIIVDGRSLPSPVAQPLYNKDSVPTTLTDRIAEFNRNPRAYIRKQAMVGPQADLMYLSPAQNDIANITTADIVTDYDSNWNPVSVPATCRLVVGPVTFADGRTRALSIWVEDSEWGAGTNQIQLSMIQALANKFLQCPESQSDIYHWDTAAVGEPWGSTTGSQYASQVISWDSNNTITIFLGKLNTSYNTGSVTVGYFWSKDNFTVTAMTGSNQRIMFYIDSYLYSYIDRGETVWAPTNYWPDTVFSTLAHEFQHMIQFYQKQVIRNTLTGMDTWINEMCSMIMEDLVADKLGVEGPRGLKNTDGSAGSAGITDGRFPSFNLYSYLGLVQKTTFNLADYSTAYAFGSWLARNYGGAGLLKKIVQCPETNETAIINAVASAETGRPTESMTRLLEKWAAAVLLSDTESAPAGYCYNTGGWMTSISGGISYKLGSIDVFNYSPSLTVFTNIGSVPSSTFTHSSNIYYEAATSLSAPRSWALTIPEGIVMSVVLK